MVMMSPVSATTKPAPADTFTLRTVMRKPRGAPSFFASSEKLYCVFAMHTGMPPKPRSSSFFSSACGLRLEVHAVGTPYTRVAMASIFCASERSSP